MELWTFWLVLAAVLLIVELFTQSLVCLYVGLGAICAVVSCVAGAEWAGAIVTFAASTTLLYLTTSRYSKRLLARLHRTDSDARTGMEALIGRTGTVELTDRARVKIDGDTWQIRPTASSAELRHGASVRIVATHSAILEVETI